MKVEISFTTLMTSLTVLLSISTAVIIHHKNVAEEALVKAQADLKMASEGKTFYLLRTDGCEQVTVRFNGQRPVWIQGPTLIGLKRPNGAVYVNGFAEETCYQSVSMALQ